MLLVTINQWLIRLLDDPQHSVWGWNGWSNLFWYSTVPSKGFQFIFKCKYVLRNNITWWLSLEWNQYRSSQARWNPMMIHTQHSSHQPEIHFSYSNLDFGMNVLFTLNICPLKNSPNGKTAIPMPFKMDIKMVLSLVVVTSPIYPYMAICKTVYPPNKV